MADVVVKNSNSAKGIGFTGLLTIAFIVLKLCGIIDWAWVWVLAPIWMSVLLVVLIFLFMLGVIVWKEARN